MKNKDCMIVKAGLWILLIANVVSFFVTLNLEVYWASFFNGWTVLSCAIPLILERR